ncbi:hypothetical protein [Phaeobacter sp. 11ANDIMAR09]|uniref:hypothetical protein n=1 Tax=Phaeobacter sp. 11ANDIMAR09 TaxID=1225647 RepID=UPI0006C8C4D1|nr:hypothetical protein [Phaeobacter sp. 11ANDIMAR09]KPD11559.1 hypothetical protein AN476_15045 [Phaeobacter sp. 11ANDIMAR09]
MATSTEQINDLIGAYTDLKNTFETKKSGIETALSAAAEAYSDFLVSFYVDQVTGNDANPGTQASPVKTIQRAIDMTPYTALADIRVRGAYTTTRRYKTMGRHVRISAYDSEWVIVSDPASYPAFTISYGLGFNDIREVWGFDISWGGYIDLVRWNVKLPSEAAVLAALPTATGDNNRSIGLFSYGASDRMEVGGGTIRYCNIDIPADYYGNLLGDYGGYYLQLANITTSGAGTYGGSVLPGAAAASPASDYGHLLMTNINTL